MLRRNLPRGMWSKGFGIFLWRGIPVFATRQQGVKRRVASASAPGSSLLASSPAVSSRVCRGTSLVSNSTDLGPYSRAMPRALEALWGKMVSYERDTPLGHQVQGLLKSNLQGAKNAKMRLAPKSVWRVTQSAAVPLESAGYRAHKKQPPRRTLQ